MDFPKSVPGVGLVNGKFIDEDPLAATPGSLIPSAWGNSVTLELLGVIKDGGLTPDEDDNTQLSEAIKKLSEVSFASQEEAEAGISTTKAMSPKRVFQSIAKVVTQATETAFGWLKIATLSQANTGTDDSAAITPRKLAAVVQTQTLTAGSTTGGATAYILSAIPGLTSYVTKLKLNVSFHIDSGANPTINVNAIGARNLKQYDSIGAKVAARVVAGQLADIEYDGTDFVILNQLPVAPSLIDSSRVDVASATIVDLSLNAPNTRQINITGAASITSFGVTAGKCYFVRFAGNITLVNGAQLVTQTGRNINANSGDTCIIRSTAANFVEVLCFSPGGGWDKSFSGDGYSRGGNGFITQWGRSAAVIPANGGTIDITFPVTFPGDIGFAGVTPVTFGVNNQCTSLAAAAINTSTLRITNWDVDSTVTQIRWFAVGY